VAVKHADDLVALATGKDSEKAGADLKKVLTAVVSVPRPTTVALFGRMIADNSAVNVDAAMQVAHAFSVDEVDIEDDFFTAVEELVDAGDSMGSAHMDTAEFISATFYRYSTLDFTELVANCGGDIALATELAAAGIKSFCLSLPSGKNNVTAPHTVPDLVSLTVSQHRPVSFAGAFEKPIKARHESPAIEGAKALGAYSKRISRMVAEADEPFGVISMLDDDLVVGLGENYAESGGLDALINAAVIAVGGSVGEV
jgi:CRISPR system Cascade subunit CasC